jgi:hypothetical protein
MTFEYVLTYRDYIDAQKLYIRHRRMAAVKYYLWIWVVPIFGLCATIPFLHGLITHSTSEFMGAYAGVAAGGAWFVLFIPLMRWYSLRRCWKAMIPRERRGKPVMLEFTDDMVISAIPGQSEGRFFWTAIQDFAQDERITLIYVRKKNFLFVPTQAVPPEHWTTVRSRLTSVLGRSL